MNFIEELIPALDGRNMLEGYESSRLTKEYPMTPIRIFVAMNIAEEFGIVIRKIMW